MEIKFIPMDVNFKPERTLYVKAGLVKGISMCHLLQGLHGDFYPVNSKGEPTGNIIDSTEVHVSSISNEEMNTLERLGMFIKYEK